MPFAVLDLPAAPTALGVLVVVFVIAYKLISDRRAVMSEIATLREQVARMDGKLTTIEGLYDEERGLKHKANNDVTRAVTTLYLVQQLAKDCSCGVLHPLVQIIERLLDEFETLIRPPVGGQQ